MKRIVLDTNALRSRRDTGLGRQSFPPLATTFPSGGMMDSNIKNMQTDGKIIVGKIMDSEIIHPRHISIRLARAARP